MTGLVFGTPEEQVAAIGIRSRLEALAPVARDVALARLERTPPPGDFGPIAREILKCAMEGTVCTYPTQAVIEGLKQEQFRGAAWGPAVLIALHAADVIAVAKTKCHPTGYQFRIAAVEAEIAKLRSWADSWGIS